MLAGGHQYAGLRVRRVGRGFPLCWFNHGFYRQPELARKRMVAFVMRGHGHDRAGAVGGQHIVGNPNRHLLICNGVHGVRTGKHARLLLVGTRALQVGAAAAGLNVLLDGFVLVLAGDMRHQRMLRRQHNVRHAIECVRPGSKHFNFFIAPINGKRE